MNKFTNEKGMSLLEVLVVITIFAVLGVLITQSIVLTLQGSQKSESMVRARENLDYSLNIIERQIRNANTIASCPNPDTSVISYLDQGGNPASFSCVNTGSDGSYIASGSARLTSSAVKIVECSFTCSLGGESNPSVVKIELMVKDASASGIRSANVSASTQIYLRNY
jgi:prepilin-type N-terminal cleavage/methylation domain-containing protein